MSLTIDNPKIIAFLDLIKWSEIGIGLLTESDHGYNVLVGGSLFTPNENPDYSDHPRQKVFIKNLNLNSTAAGAFQIIERYFDYYKKMLTLPDFSPDSQRKIAYHYLIECRALELIDNGEIDKAIFGCSSRWASFPGGHYGQHENKIQELLDKYDVFYLNRLSNGSF